MVKNSGLPELPGQPDDGPAPGARTQQHQVQQKPSHH